MPGRIEIEVGQTFGRWTVLGEAPTVNDERRLLCKCACGVERSVALNSLRKGRSHSCGCYKLDELFIHGASGNGKYRAHRWYKAWSNMHDRCYNPNYEGYKHYGGRGISVCERWRNDPLRFLHDMGDPPRRMSLDRIDTNGDYSQNNCRWATAKQQCRNKRTNVMVTFRGKRVCLSEAAEMAGLRYSVVWQRCNHGWSVEHALTAPVGSKR